MSRRPSGPFRRGKVSRAVQTHDDGLRERITRSLPLSLRRGVKSNVTIAVRDGFVTLEGAVRSYREKIRLHRFVMSLPGVRALKDLLAVEPTETLADGQIALHIRQTLDGHSELSPGTATVFVHNGACRLTGHVCTAEERHIAEHLARNCRGVKVVVNRLTVDPLDELSDAATTRVVKCALAYAQEFETEGVSVSCTDGRIALRGEVPTLLDRLLAEEIARLQPGVRCVDNHLRVGTRFVQEEKGSGLELRRRRRPAIQGD